MSVGFFVCRVFCQLYSCAYAENKVKISKLTGNHELFLAGGNGLFFRRINEAGDCNMETAYSAFATQVIELCNGGMDMNLTVIALAYIGIELQHHPVRNLSEERREIAAYVSKALSFVKKDAEIPCHAPSATTNIRQQRNRNHRQPSSMARATPSTSCGTYLRHRRVWVASTTAICRSNSSPHFSIRYSELSLKTATASTRHQTPEERKPLPISSTKCRKN